MFSEKEIFIGVGIFIIIGSLLAIYFVLNSEDKLNSNNQINENSLTGKVINIFSKKDKNYCGDGYCYINEDGDYENCNICSSDCGTCGDTNKCGDNFCSIGECNTCFSDCSLLECENGICEQNKGENCVTAPNDCKCQENYVCDSKIEKCIYSKDKIEHIYDKEEIIYEPSNENYPIIFIHGHSFESNEISGNSLNTFLLIENKMIYEGLVERGTTLFPSSDKNSYKEGLFANKGKPVIFVTTYYTKVSNIDSVFIEDGDTASIKVYGSRLSNVVDIVLKTTKKEKVNIVAHSMGGLVAREYVQQTEGKYVNKLITIGTPNNGIWKRDIQANVWFVLGQGCNIGHPGIECDEMHHDSQFLEDLNSEDIKGDVEIYTIAGRCGVSDVGINWDNVVRVESVKINDAVSNYIVNCKNPSDYSWSGNSFHNAMLNPNEVSEVYNKVIEFLKN